MRIDTLTVGPLQTNCYILEKQNEVILIDPGDDFNRIKDVVGNRKVVACLLTHAHFDHVGALKQVLSFYKLKVNEYKGQTFLFEVINTPGHTADSVTFYFEEEKAMFVGDFIFYHSIGRTDLGGNDSDMKNSLDKIKEYPEDITIYPGHGSTTTLKEEKKFFSYYY